MARPCSVCTHAQRQAVDQAIVAGESAAKITAKFREISDDAVLRHKDSHLPTTLVKAHAEQDVRQALDVVAQLKAINQASLAVLKQARQTGDGELALKAVDRVQRQIELQAKLLGELDERPQVNVLALPEWAQVRVIFLQALEPYPEARAAVAARLMALEAETNGHRG
jgi:hypothetical protein